MSTFIRSGLVLVGLVTLAAPSLGQAPTFDASKVSLSASIQDSGGGSIAQGKPGLINFFLANRTPTTVGPNTLPAGTVTVIVPSTLALDLTMASSVFTNSSNQEVFVFPPAPTGMTVTAVAGGSQITFSYPSLGAMQAARYSIGFTPTASSSGDTVPFNLVTAAPGVYSWQAMNPSALMASPGHAFAALKRKSMRRRGWIAGILTRFTTRW